MASSPALDDDTVRVNAPARGEDEVTSAPGSTLGRYLVIDELGRGGMGVVLRAYDPKLQREVALKCLRQGTAPDEARDALVHEARSMAQLSHPNVVSVYDVEQAGDSVVLAMECIDGTTMVEWMRTKRPWREVVALLVAAGSGLQAAHAVGVLHRDFKPGNVLVTRDGRPKVTDFGLAGFDAARSSREELVSVADIRRSAPYPLVESSTDVSRISVSRDSMGDALTVKGTPAYMAPEQHRGEALTAAADQYAFCVSAWQALTGDLPFFTRGKSPHRVAREKDAGPPTWPRSVDVPRPIVDAIVRGLQADPALRWPSMAELLTALARDPHRRRRIVGWSAAAVVLFGGSIAATAAWLQHQGRACQGAEQQLAGIWDDARRGEAEQAIVATDLAYAPQAWVHASAVLDRYAGDWVAAHTETCEATSVRGEQSAQVMDLRMNCLRRARLQLQATVSALAAADRATVDKAHVLVDGLPELALCDDIEALQSETVAMLGETDRERVRAVEATLAAAQTQIDIGNFDPARAATASIAAEVDDLDHAPTRAAWALASGLAASGAGDYAAAESDLAEALRAGLGARSLRLAATAAQHLTLLVGVKRGRPAEGLAYSRTAMGLSDGLGPIARASALSNLAGVHNALGEYAAAEAELREAVALHEDVDPESVAAASVRDNLAVILLMQGKLDEAEAGMRAALAIYERELGPSHPELIASRSNLGALLHTRGAFAEAEVEMRAVIELSTSKLGGDHPEVARVRSNHAVTLSELGRHAEAELEAREALAIFTRALGPDHPNVAYAHGALATAQAGAGKTADAEASYLHALATWEKNVGRDGSEQLSDLVALGMLRLEHGRAREAVEPLDRAYRITVREGGGPMSRGELAFALARALAEDPQTRARSLELADEAIAALEPGDVRDRARTWLRARR